MNNNLKYNYKRRKEYIDSLCLFVLWHGIVSSLRTYSAEGMNNLVKDLHNTETYSWQINRVKSGPGVVLYLIGTEKK